MEHSVSDWEKVKLTQLQLCCSHSVGAQKRSSCFSRTLPRHSVSNRVARNKRSRFLLSVHADLRRSAGRVEMHKMQLFSNFASKGNLLPVDSRAFLKGLSIPPKSRFQEQPLHKGKSPRPSLSQSNAHCDCLSPSFKHILVFRPSTRSSIHISDLDFRAVCPPKKLQTGIYFLFNKLTLFFTSP